MEKNTKLKVEIIRTILLTIFCLAMTQVIGFGNALAVAEQPLENLRDNVGKILTILKDPELAVPERHDERRKKVESVVDTVFDFQEMAKRSLAKNWKKMSANEKTEFVDLFSRLVKQRYIGKIDAYSGQQVEFKKEVVKGKAAIIYSVLSDHGTEIPIDYKVRQKNSQWLVYDMRIENVSLAANYRRDFGSILNKKGLGELIKRIKEKVEKNEAAK